MLVWPVEADNLIEIRNFQSKCLFNAMFEMRTNHSNLYINIEVN